MRTLKYYIDANLESAGDSVERLQQSRKQYVALIEEKKKLQEEKVDKGWSKVEELNVTHNYSFMCINIGSQSQVILPIGEGSLIIDEVKVCVHTAVQYTQM